jgi:hypothetical protein
MANPTTIAKPFHGTIFYSLETGYGLGLAVASKLPISKYVQNVRIGTGDKHNAIRGIDSPLVKNLMMQTNEPELHIEYNPQVGDTLIDDVVDRGTCNILQSLAFAIGVSTCTVPGEIADDTSYFEVRGCKPSTVKIASAHNEPYTITIDYLAKSVITYNDTEAATAGIGNDVDMTTQPTALTGIMCQFNVAGEIQKSGGDYLINTDHLAYITNSIDITIDHQLTGYTDHDSINKSYLVEGTMDVSGSVDITMDGGGKAHIREVLNQTNFTIVVNLGTVSGSPIITLANCKWDSGEVTPDIGGETVMSSCPFTAVPASTAIVTEVA